MPAEANLVESFWNSPERFRTVLDAMGVGMYGIDSHGQGTFVNKKMTELLGYTQDDILGKRTHAILHNKHSDGSPYPVEDCPIYKAFQVGEGCRVDDEVIWSKDGKPVPTDYTSYPIEENGQIVGAVVTFVDNTERQKIQHELEHHMSETDRLNKMMVGRELKMVEMKEEIERLKTELAKKG